MGNKSVAVDAVPTEAELLARVEELAPLVERSRPWQESNRRMAPEVFEALSTAGMFALCKPRAVGGYELPPVTSLKIFEALARLDASVGWTVANQDGLDVMVGAVLPSGGALEAMADTGRPLSGGAFPPGRARATEGGYLINGRFTFASTCHYAQGIVGVGLLIDDDGPVMSEQGLPIAIMVCAEPDEVEIVDTWRTMGMRGSGSHDTVMTEVFVPAHRAGLMAQPGVTTDGPLGGALYALAPWFSIATTGPVGLGIAEAALDALIDIAGSKKPNFTTRALQDRDSVQGIVGRCRSIINGARVYLHHSVDALYVARVAGRSPSQQERLDVQLSASAANEAGTAVTELVHRAVGSSGFQENLPFEQLFRDSHTIGQNTFASIARYEVAGQVLMGMPADFPIVAWGLAR